MKLSDFDFNLPQNLIAQTPAKPRDHAKLLVYYRADRTIVDDYFYNLNQYLNPRTTLVLNNSKVEKCRLQFGKIELFVTETINPTTIVAMVRPGKLFKLGVEVDLGPVMAKVVSINEEGLRTLILSVPIDSDKLDQYRLTPLPPYIAQNEDLAEQYQTIYAKPLGSKAAPTAGLHFTKHQLSELAKSHNIAELTLHVGLGTFVPIKLDNIEQHKMHHEWFELNHDTAQILNDASHITAVGTTSARTLESLAKPFQACSGETNIFIKPGYRFQNVDALITNFHLPKSTLLLLVSSFLGSTDEMHRIYQHAITNKYRFYSFGDVMLIV